MRRFALVLACAALAGGVTYAAAAPAPSNRELRAEIRDVMKDEERAWQLLAKKPPRFETAQLVLTRAREALLRLERQVPAAARDHLREAWRSDGNVLGWIEARRVEEGTFRNFTHAHGDKTQALSALLDSRPDAPQCGDGRDNDGDGLADNAFDSGCTSAKDATERSPLTCSLETSAAGVGGTCSGTFARVEIVLPRGGFDVTKPPTADLSAGCRYASERKLECVFRDGQANPRHRLRVRFRASADAMRGSRVTLLDFRNRRFRNRRAAAPQPPAPAFQVGTTATYVHRGSTSDVCVFVWTRPAQPPLRGSVTLSGAGGEQTKAFTTLGGEAKTLVRFTVAQRDRYVADVSLAGKTAQTAVSLGLAPTTSGEFSCLP